MGKEFQYYLFVVTLAFFVHQEIIDLGFFQEEPISEDMSLHQ
jgi:hypothetical protein